MGQKNGRYLKKIQKPKQISYLKSVKIQTRIRRLFLQKIKKFKWFERVKPLLKKGFKQDLKVY